MPYLYGISAIERYSPYEHGWLAIGYETIEEIKEELNRIMTRTTLPQRYTDIKIQRYYVPTLPPYR